MLFFCGMMSCGIEVGNPHDDTNTGKTEAMIPITIALADSPVDNLAHLYLNIKGINLVVQGGDQMLSLALTAAANAPVDVLSLQDGLTAILVQDQNIPPAKYNGFVIELASDKIGWAVEKGGATKTLVLPQQSNHYLWISQDFNMAAADQIVLHLDIFQSLRQSADGSYQLLPVFNPVSSHQASSLEGTIPQATDGIVCSYLQSISQDDAAMGQALTAFMSPDGPPPGASLDGDGTLQPPPPDGFSNHVRVPGIGPRPSGPFPGDAGENAPFGSCFISAPVRSDGTFKFHFLRPGTYSLRYFPTGKDGQNIKGTFTVPPPAGDPAVTPVTPIDIGTVSFES